MADVDTEKKLTLGELYAFLDQRFDHLLAALYILCMIFFLDQHFLVHKVVMPDIDVNREDKSAVLHCVKSIVNKLYYIEYELGENQHSPLCVWSSFLWNALCKDVEGQLAKNYWFWSYVTPEGKFKLPLASSVSTQDIEKWKAVIRAYCQHIKAVLHLYPQTLVWNFALRPEAPSKCSLGREGEQTVFDYLVREFGTEANVRMVRNSPCSGDILFDLWGETIMVEVKNHASTVGRSDVLKCADDMRESNIEKALFISLRSPILSRVNDSTFTSEKYPGIFFIALTEAQFPEKLANEIRYFATGVPPPTVNELSDGTVEDDSDACTNEDA